MVVGTVRSVCCRGHAESPQTTLLPDCHHIDWLLERRWPPFWKEYNLNHPHHLILAVVKNYSRSRFFSQAVSIG